jgi:hypothetical protein
MGYLKEFEYRTQSATELIDALKGIWAAKYVPYTLAFQGKDVDALNLRRTSSDRQTGNWDQFTIYRLAADKFGCCR